MAAAANAAVAAKQTVSFEVGDYSGKDPVGTGQLRFGDDGSAIAMRSVQDGEEFEFRAVDGVIYMKATGELGGMAGGKPWLTFSEDGDDPISQVMGGLLTGMAKEVDPARTFEITDAAGSIASAESDMIDGDAVMRYTIDLETERLIDHVANTSGKDSLQVKAMRTALDQGVTSVSTEVWLDGDDLPRRFVVADVPALAQDGAPSGDGLPRVTITYSDWGGDVDVDAPPQNEVGTVQMPG
ncbi:MAG: hypothetical protein GEU97_05015 [Actinophytocola sp.]|nr:hypothetical protein [Actinophytocola sp.]